MDPEMEEIHDGATVWRFDRDFLASTWACLWGRGCLGIGPDPAEHLGLGCCSLGADFEDGFQVFNMMDPTNPYTVGTYKTYDKPHASGALGQGLVGGMPGMVGKPVPRHHSAPLPWRCGGPQGG